MPRSAAAGVTIIVVVTLGYGAALAFDYIGSTKCKMCHKGEAKGRVYEIWEASRHAQSFVTLKEKGEQENPDCLVCHVTGWEQPTGYGSEGADDDALASVGCEACHGPGSDYRQMSIMRDRETAIENGLMIPDEETCKACHNENSPTFQDFDFEEDWKTIEHHTPEE